jgi:hypothetical protein
MLDSLFLMQNFCCLCVMIGQASFVVGFIWMCNLGSQLALHWSCQLGVFQCGMAVFNPWS